MTDERQCSHDGCPAAGVQKFGRGWYCDPHFHERIEHNTARRRAAATPAPADDTYTRRARGLAVLAEQARDVDRAKDLYRRTLRALARDEGILQ